MTIRRTLVAWTAVVLAALVARAAPDVAPGSEQAGWRIAVRCDRENGLYAAGDPIVFTVQVARDDKPPEQPVTVDYTILLNGKQEIERKTLTLESGAATVRTQRSEPGCLILAAACRPADSVTIKAEVGAAVESEKLAPSLPMPDDFDAFWAAQKQRLAETPMNVQWTRVEVPDVPWAGDVECFEVRADVPKPWAAVTGYFARPKDAKARSCPAWISFHGAGARSATLATVAGRAKHYGMLGMEINAHGLPNGRPEQFYKDQLEDDLKGYAFRGNDLRDTCYFLGMYLRLARAVEFLCAQDAWDGRTVIASGSSQGGAQALVAAGLDSRVTIVSAGVPALCDLAGPAAGRASGWPLGPRDLSDAQMQAMRYFDVCHFAARTRATAVVRIGLVDRTCWAAGTLAMANQLKGPKHIITSPLSGHAWSPPTAYAQAQALFNELLARCRQPQQPPTP
ncbi:MAG TPA: acetylxylan esterase [Phycisphaerae bacterium]|nr:acetylxylan esterase [Phycisphaerae bacterium]